MHITSNFKSYQQMKSTGSQSKDILNHRKAATFLARAARLHLEAAKQRLEGNSEKVTECTLVAQGLLQQVTEMQKVDMINIDFKEI